MKIVYFLLYLTCYYCSGLSESGKEIIDTETIQQSSNVIEKWKTDRFYPHHRDNQNEKDASVKLGLNLKWVEFSMENDNHSQTGISTDSQGASSLTSGKTISFGKKLTLSYEVLFAYKFSTATDAPIVGINFWFFQQKPVEGTYTIKNNEKLSSTYYATANSFISNINTVTFDHDLRLRNLKVFIAKYLFSANHFFFASGFGSNILIVEHNRNVTYSSDNLSHCICLSQKLKGADIHLLTNLGINVTNSLGLEIYYENGLFLNSYTIHSKSYVEDSLGVMEYANVLSNTGDINQSQYFSILVAYNNFQFSKYHYAAKIGIELYSMQADRITKALGQSYSGTKDFYLPSIILGLDVYF